MTSENSTTALTTTGMLLAVSLILYFVGLLLPSFGTYLRYLIPGLMAVLKTRYGYRYLISYSVSLAVLVTLFFGIEELIISLFLYIPAGFVLPLLYENNTFLNKLIAGAVFAVFAVLLVLTLSFFLGANYQDMFMDVAELNYTLFGEIYERGGMDRAYFTDLMIKSIWFVVALTGVIYGVVLYAINKVVYKKGLEIISQKKAAVN